MRFYKKAAALLLMLLCALLMTACGKAEQEQTGQESPLAPIPTDPVYEGTNLADSPFVGSFSCSWSALYASATDGADWQGRVSTLVVEKDGSFTLTFDSMDAAGMVTVRGSVKVTDDTAVCTVSERSAQNYLGEELTEFSLHLINENELRYAGGQQGAACERDIYTREG